MILALSRDVDVNYAIPAGITTPKDVAWSLVSPPGETRASGTVSAPEEHTVDSAEDGLRANQPTLTLTTTTPDTLEPGQALRVTDTWGLTRDALLVGAQGSSLRLDDYGGEASEIATVWCPEVSIALTGEDLDEVSDGWRLEIATGSRRDQLAFAVCRYALDSRVSLREYLDVHPDASSDIAALERRRDWSRHVQHAVRRVETSLRGEDRWLHAVLDTDAIDQAVIAALHVTLLPVMARDRDDLAELRAEAYREYRDTIREVVAGAAYDADQDGETDDTEQRHPQVTRIVRT